MAKVPQLVRSRAGTGIQSGRPLYDCSASSFVCPIHVKECCLLHVSIPITNTGNGSFFPSPLSATGSVLSKQTQCLASRQRPGSSQGSFSVISRQEHQLTLPLSVYFGQGSGGEGQGRVNVFRKQSISRTWHIFRRKITSTVRCP